VSAGESGTGGSSGTDGSGGTASVSRPSGFSDEEGFQIQHHNGRPPCPRGSRGPIKLTQHHLGKCQETRIQGQGHQKGHEEAPPVPDT